MSSVIASFQGMASIIPIEENKIWVTLFDIKKRRKVLRFKALVTEVRLSEDFIQALNEGCYEIIKNER